MIVDIIRASGTFVLTIVLFFIGRDIKRRLEAIEDVIDARVRRVDEASQWGPGDIITFGDGSRIIVASQAPSDPGRSK